MKRYVEIINNRVTYSFHEFENDFHPQYDSNVLTMVDVTYLAIPPKQGDIYDGANFSTPAPPQKTITELQVEIRIKYAAQMAQVATPYRLEERETWFTQLKEADEWLAGNTTITPMLTAMATERGITVGDLVGKIKENDNLFRQAIGELLGKQQRELDVLK